MNTRSAFTVLFVCLTFNHVVLTEKYPFIGSCEIITYTHLSFICDTNTFRNGYCYPNSDMVFSNIICLYKSQISEIDFVNCDQPKILNDIFHNYENILSLNMSHLGMKTDQISFLSEPNKLNTIDASHNNIETILNGMFRLNISFLCNFVLLPIKFIFQHQSNFFQIHFL